MPTSQPVNSDNQTPDSEIDSGPALHIASDKITFIILKARQYDVKEAVSDPDSGSNASDDGMTDVLEDNGEDPARRELIRAIRSLNEDEQVELVALAWLGRGTYTLDEWEEAVQTARDEHNNRTAQYLLGLPLLGDYLEEGLAAFGISYVDSAESN
jgi:hypothetical protein